MTISHEVPVSVVIPSYNPGRTILPCIESVRSQEIEGRVEIIVADSSTDDTPQILEHMPDVQIIHRADRLFPGAARNLGAKHARGWVVAFIDADCTASPGWLGTLLESHAAGNQAVGGAIANGTPESMVGSAEYFLEFGEFSPARPAGPMRFAPTCNFSMDLGIFRRSGGFPDLRASEDVLFGLRLMEMGVAVRFEPQAMVFHRCRSAPGPFLRNQVNLGRGAAAARRMAPLPGAFVARMPVLIPLLPLLRFYRMFKRLIRHEPRSLIPFLRVFPLLWMGLGAWSWGFFRESCKRRL
ncbi:MAG: glycosyltransferase [Deltaproteobacteria bacterium]|nr:glycosyltransferase [Deltaproteobacteria bacterium]